MEVEKNYPCAECGMPRTKDQGGTIFTVCDDCWGKAHSIMIEELPMSERSDEATGYNRANYIKKLIDEIRVDIKKEMVEVDGELCYTQKWINVALLCDVVSKEL